jgi:hypothetical protein
MMMLVIFTNIICHPITRDQLINLRNVGSNGTPLISLVIQTQITNQCHLKCWHQWNLLIPLVIQTHIANQYHKKC